MSVEARPSHARVGVSVAQLEAYLVTHAAHPTTLEFLVRDGDDWLVRWPVGNVRWEQGASLVARGFALPAAGLLNDRSPVEAV